MITVFCVLAAIAFLFYSIIWSSTGLANVAAKMANVMMFLFAVLCALVSSGIVR